MYVKCSFYIGNMGFLYSSIPALASQLTNVKTHEVLNTRTYIAFREDMQMDVFSVFCV